MQKGEMLRSLLRSLRAKSTLFLRCLRTNAVTEKIAFWTDRLLERDVLGDPSPSLRSGFPRVASGQAG